MMHPRKAAQHLWEMGANVTAIADGKKPIHLWDAWQEKRQTQDVLEGIQWNGKKSYNGSEPKPAALTVGIISGVNGWRCLDIDAVQDDTGEKKPVPEGVVHALLDALDLPHVYEWYGRSRSGNGWHIWFRCDGDLPPELAQAGKVKETGVKVGTPTDTYSGQFDHIELRWERCQTVLPAPTGYNGHLPNDPPALVEVDQVVAAFLAIATPRRHEENPHQPQRQQKASKPSANGSVNREQQWNEGIAARMFETAADMVRNPGAYDKEGHHKARYAAGRLLGGLVDHGLATEDEIEAHLLAAKPPSSDTRKERKAITDGIAAGRAEGLDLSPVPDNNPPRASSNGHHLTNGRAPERAQARDGQAASGAAAPAVDSGFVFECLRQEEAGDAQLFARLFERRVLYDHATKTWYRFVGHYWQPYHSTPNSLVWGELASVYLSEAARLTAAGEIAADDMLSEEAQKKKELTGQADTLTRRARTLRGRARISNVLALAVELVGIAGDEWDSDPWVIGVANGVLDLRTGTLRDGTPDDYIRTTAPTEWRGVHEPCPRWERFVSEIMNDEADRAAFLQRLLGYSLNGTTSEHVLALLVGERGRNGKGVLCDTVLSVLGEYAGMVSTDVIVGNDKWRAAGSAQPYLMDLMGKRFTTCAESEEHAQLTTAQVKQVTGGGRIKARRLHENSVEFEQSHTLFLQTNRKPHAPSDDDALWERVKVIEFRTRFVDDPQTADERQRDSKLIETLKQEHSGILAWLVRGHLDWRRGGLQTPESVKVARDTYRNEESIEPFVAACCYESIEASAEASVLYEGYKRWCEARGYRAKSTTWFGRQARAIYEKGRTATGRACYYGIGLLPDDEWTNPSGGTNSSETLRGASGSQETPAETDAPEGFGTVSKSFCHGVLVKENNMENASDPSDPSGETDKTTEHPPCTPDEPSASGAAPEPPEGWQLVRCDHRGNVTRFGAYWRAVHDDGTMADVTQYPDSAARLAWAAQARE